MFSWELARAFLGNAGDRPIVGTRRANGAGVSRVNKSSY